MVRRMSVVGTRFGCLCRLGLCRLCFELVAVAGRIVWLRLVWLERLGRRSPRGSSWEGHDGDVDECVMVMVLIVTIRQVVFVFVVVWVWMKMSVEIVILHDFDAIHY